MQTQQEVREKIFLLSKHLHTELLKEISILLDHSVVNLSAHDNDFVLPKILYNIALKRIAEHYAPLTPEYREMLREIEVWT